MKLHKFILAAFCGLFSIWSVWWLCLLVIVPSETTVATSSFGGTYGLVALLGGVYGLFAARNWGFWKSYFGKAVILLSLGLLLQEFGQLTFLYFNAVAEIDIPYPSIADIGFFGAIPAYIAGAFFLMKGLGVAAIIKKSPLKLMAGILVPLIILGVSYWFFLRGYEAAGLSNLTIFFDFGYPLGQAMYISIALVILLSLGRILGGVMKLPVFMLLLAFIIQYAADFNFLFQAHQGTWNPSGSSYGDYLYLFAYFVMSLSLVLLSRALAKAFAKSSSNGDG